MRLLFTFIGGSGHLQPLVPLARAAEAAGHSVAVAGSGKVTDAVRAAGFESIATSAPAEAATTSRATRDLSPLEPADGEAAELEFVENFARKGARRHAAALLDVVRAWQPDVVVRDEADFGAGIAAERLGVPCAVVLVLAAGSLVRRDLVPAALDEVRGEHGLGPDPALRMLDGDLVLSPFPPSFRHPDHPLPAGAFTFRTQVAGQPRADQTPVAYFTLGTSFNSASGDLMERVLAGLHDFPGRVVATVGRGVDPTELPPQPGHITLERYVDQAALLPSCDVVISHGGSGSVVGALAHGLPTLLLPLGADQTHNAERVTELGLGLALDAVTATPAGVGAAVRTLLDEPAYRRAAGVVAAEIASQPGPDAVVPLLEAMG